VSVRIPVPVAQARHAGLYLDKFIAADKQKEQGAELAAVASSSGFPWNSLVYRRAFARWEHYWKNQGGRTVCLRATVRTRLAIGLGAESVTENGLRLHFTYGTPLIPGSAIKGAMCARLRDVNFPEREDAQKLLFGEPDFAGDALYADAWWVPSAAKPLSLDVLTPHHQQYQARLGPPTDFDEPVPVHFLTVRGTFLFVIEAPTQAWADFARDLLKDTLQNHGLGAKRNAGYGLFQV